MGTWNVPAMLSEIPLPLYRAWFDYYTQEPWDVGHLRVPSGLRGTRSVIDGSDAESLESAFDRWGHRG